MSDKTLDELGGLQKAVMEALWERGEATVQQVRDRLDVNKAYAYTTVLSVMQKLEKAGWLTHRAEGRTYFYRPTRSRQEAGVSSLRTFIDRVFQGNPLVLFQHLIDDEDLSDRELAALRKMLDARRKERRDG